jgi:hypothetical protein
VGFLFLGQEILDLGAGFLSDHQHKMPSQSKPDVIETAAKSSK